MTSWRDSILAQLVPRVSRLTLVADPDALLTEERLALELHKHGFDLIEFSNPVDFRYAYESRFRAIWDQGRQTELDVVVRLSDSKLDALPMTCERWQAAHVRSGTPVPPFQLPNPARA